MRQSRGFAVGRSARRVAPVHTVAQLAVRIAALITVLAWTEPAEAYAWMLRHGYAGCITCHADPSGGELLTAYGRAQGELLVRMRFGGGASEARSNGSGIDEFDDFDAPGDAEQERSLDEEEPGAAAGFLWGLVEPPEWLLLGGSYRHMLILSEGDVGGRSHRNRRGLHAAAVERTLC